MSERLDLWTPSSHYRQTRKGKILRSTNENYLRDDLGMGFTIVSSVKHKRNNISIQGPGTTRQINSLEELISIVIPSKVSATDGHAPRTKTRLVIVDTNVLLHNLDVLEHSMTSIPNLVIPQTALQECRHRSFTAYGRVMDLLRSSSSSSVVKSTSTCSEEEQTTEEQKRRRCVIFFPDSYHYDTQIEDQVITNEGKKIKKSMNEVNDERIRNVAAYYGKALYAAGAKDIVEVVLMTDDRGCRELASQEQIQYYEEQNDMEDESGMMVDNDEDDDDEKVDKESWLYAPKSVRNHIRDLEKEDPSISLSDMVAQFTVSSSSNNTTSLDSSSTQASKPKYHFPPHLSQKDLSLGVKSGKYFQGCIRPSGRNSCDEFYVTIRRGEDRVAVTIPNVKDANRAVDGDIVGIELYPVEMWKSSSPDTDTATATTISSGENKEDVTDDEDGGTVGIAQETADASLRDEANVDDVVEVPINNSSSNIDTALLKPVGKVVGIIRRNFRKNYCGSIYSLAPSKNDDGTADDNSSSDPQQAQNQKLQMKKTKRQIITDMYEVEHRDGTITCVFFAVDGRVPPVLVRTAQRDRLIGKRILIAIDSWPSNSEYPLGHYVKTIGDTGLKDVETEVLLHEHNIPCDPFPAKVLACLPPDDYKIELEDGRLDLRHLPVLSIDPPGCKDIDDALHCIVLPNKNYQMGVHIADVTHYVKAGAAIDLEAANRSTSTYLVNKRLDMLPSLLTTDLCSLKGNVDRFAFSVLWEVSPNGDIIDVEFHKSIIHSIAALTYQQAQSLIDQPDHDDHHKVYNRNGKQDKEHIQVGAVKRLASLARIFRSKRLEAGALTLASPEVKFTLDSESLNPTDVQSYQLYEANAVVEEFMLLANVTVGKKILRQFPTLSILRRHPSPNRSMFDALISKAKCRGFDISIEDSKHLADSLDKAVIEDDPYFNKLLRILSTRCMVRTSFISIYYC